MTLYGITTCGSVKKARKFLDEKGISYDFVDLKKTAVDEGKIKTWLKSVELKQLLNTKGTKYRTLGLSKMDLTDDRKVEWMAKENLIIKRPVIELDDGSTICAFDEERYNEIFG